MCVCSIIEHWSSWNLELQKFGQNLIKEKIVNVEVGYKNQQFFILDSRLVFQRLSIPGHVCKNCPCQYAACQSVSPPPPLIANKMISQACRLLHLHLLPPMLLGLLSAPLCLPSPTFLNNLWIIALPPHASLFSVAFTFAQVSHDIT